MYTRWGYNEKTSEIWRKKPILDLTRHFYWVSDKVKTTATLEVLRNFISQLMLFGLWPHQIFDPLHAPWESVKLCQKCFDFWLESLSYYLLSTCAQHGLQTAAQSITLCLYIQISPYMSRVTICWLPTDLKCTYVFKSSFYILIILFI